MPEGYNPIVRTFCRLRSGVLDCLAIDRHEVRPGTPLEDLLPVDQRRRVWEHLQRLGLRLPSLELSPRDHRRNLLQVIRGAVSSALYLQKWYTLLAFVPLALAVHWATRRRAVQFPSGIHTLGQLVIYSTCFAEHKESGYRWTRNEIELKVRMIIAEMAGLPLDAVQPETRLIDL
jgi:hypothetical protein